MHKKDERDSTRNCNLLIAKDNRSQTRYHCATHPLEVKQPVQLLIGRVKDDLKPAHCSFPVQEKYMGVLGMDRIGYHRSRGTEGTHRIYRTKTQRHIRNYVLGTTYYKWTYNGN